MLLLLLWALFSARVPSSAQEGGELGSPVISVSANARLLSDVLADLTKQTGMLMVADPFSGARRITVEVSSKPLTEALNELAVAAVATWDSGYIIVPTGGPYGPESQPSGWERPPQTSVTLSGGSAPVEKIAAALTNLSAAPVGYAPGTESIIVTTQPTENASLEEVLSQLQGDRLTWTRGIWFAPIDRAAVFGRYSRLPPEAQEERVLRHVEQMLRLRKDDVRQALEARHREVAGMDPATRQAEIQRYAQEIRNGINVLNGLSSAVRDRAREAMQIFFEIGLEVYRDLTEEEQLETTPIIEAMGELQR